jgi:hypothetical protein
MVAGDANDQFLGAIAPFLETHRDAPGALES